MSQGVRVSHARALFSQRQGGPPYVTLGLAPYRREVFEIVRAPMVTQVCLY